MILTALADVSCPQTTTPPYCGTVPTGCPCVLASSTALPAPVPTFSAWAFFAALILLTIIGVRRLR